MTYLERIDAEIKKQRGRIEELHTDVAKKYALIVLLGTLLFALVQFLTIGYINPIHILCIPLPAVFLYVIIILVFDATDEQSLSIHSRIKQLNGYVSKFEQHILDYYNMHPNRTHRSTIKGFYKLAKMPVEDIETLMPIIMYKEVKEVSVTLFCKNGMAVKVMANKGSMGSVRLTFDPIFWNSEVIKHGCDQVRHYHNHPGNGNGYFPSKADIEFYSFCNERLSKVKISYQSYIIGWNKHWEWKIYEYWNKPECNNLVKEYDVSDHHEKPKLVNKRFEFERGENGIFRINEIEETIVEDFPDTAID